MVRYNEYYMIVPEFYKSMAPLIWSQHPPNQHLFDFFSTLDISCADNDPTRVLNSYNPAWWTVPPIGDGVLDAGL